MMEDDIEDVVPKDGLPEGPGVGRSTHSDMMVKGNFASLQHVPEAVDEAKDQNTPGTQSIYMKTYGCSHNVSDSEYMAGMLGQYGYRMTENKLEADLWLVNSCTVKDPSQAAFMHMVKKAKEEDRPIVVAGCVSQADRKIPGLEDVSVVGIHNIDRVVEVVETTLQGNTVKMLGKKSLPRLDLPKVRKNKLIEIIPLSTGCLGACTYCKTKHARGKLGSYELDVIVERARTVVEEGVNEIWLSSEDTGAYGRDIGTDIVKLLWAIIDILPEEGVMLRVGMTNPPYILEHLENIAKVLRHPKVFAFLHVPLQSAADAVLTSMYREYTVDEFCRIADYLLREVPDITLATDIICGFPNETEQHFQETMDLMARYKFPIVNISQFYPRPGTPAAKMKRIATQIVKDRSRRITALFEGFRPYNGLVGRVIKVWFSTETSEDGHHNVAHSKAYVKVLVPLNPSLPGQVGFVKVQSADRFHVTGVLLEGEELERYHAGGAEGNNATVFGSVSSLFQYKNVPNSALVIAAVLSIGAFYVARYVGRRK